MAAPRTTYRIASYDSARKIVTAELFEAVSDEDAITRTKTAGFGTKCEIWDSNRLVAELVGERLSA